MHDCDLCVNYLHSGAVLLPFGLLGSDGNALLLESLSIGVRLLALTFESLLQIERGKENE